MPCTNRAEQEYAFFRKHGLKRTTDISRYGIDVDLIVKTTAPREETTKVKYSGTELKVWNGGMSNAMIESKTKVDNIIRSIQIMPENRHRPFFDAAIEFRSLGLTLPEIEQCCYEMAGNEKKMKDKVPGIISSLEKYQH